MAHTCGVATISRLLKLQVSFVEYSLLYRALLQKRPIILRSLLTKATPYLDFEMEEMTLQVQQVVSLFLAQSM